MSGRRGGSRCRETRSSWAAHPWLCANEPANLGPAAPGVQDESRLSILMDGPSAENGWVARQRRWTLVREARRRV